MNARQMAQLTRLKHVVAFIDAYPASDPRAQRIERDFRAAVATIEQLVLKQRSANNDRLEHTRAGARFRRALRVGQMIPIRRDASVLLRDVDGVARALEVPHATADGKALVAAAARMGKGLTPYVRFLRQHGFAQGFLADLRLAALAVRRWEAASSAVAQERVRATADLKRAFQHGHRLMLSLEGSAMERGLRDPGLWKMWVWTRKTRKKTGRPRKPRPQ